MTTYESFQSLGIGVKTAPVVSAPPSREPSMVTKPGGKKQQFWMDDASCKACFNCEAPFSLFRRKHHCRSCGAIYCDKCSSKTADGSLYGYDGQQVRVCDACYESATQVQRGIDRKKNRSFRFLAHHSSSSSSSASNSQALDEVSQPAVHQEISFEESDVTEDNQSWHLKGTEEKERKRTSSRRRVSVEPTDLVEVLGFDQQVPGTLTACAKEEEDEEKHALTLNRRAVSSRFLRQRSNSLREEEALFTVKKSDFDNRSRNSHGFAANDTVDLDTIETIKVLRNEYTKRINAALGRTEAVIEVQADLFVKRLDKAVERFVHREIQALREKRPSILLSEHVQQLWIDKLISITRQICSMVRPFNMDFDTYCRLVSIPGGSISESYVLDGVICEKNVVHRMMRKRLENPRIMLVEGAIEFLRDKSRISSLDTLREQEVQYMHLVVRKIASVGVDLLLVGSAVSRVAQQLLLEEGISLVINVPKQLLERISWFTGALILPTTGNITQQSDPRGTCGVWELRSFNTNLTDTQRHELLERVGNEKAKQERTFMFFEGCTPRQGTSICLRGGSAETLQHMERILTKMITLSYTLKQEHALFTDIGVCFGEDKYTTPTSIAIEDSLLDAEELDIVKYTTDTRDTKDTMHRAELRKLAFGPVGSDVTLGEFLRKRFVEATRRATSANAATSATAAAFARRSGVSTGMGGGSAVAAVGNSVLASDEKRPAELMTPRSQVNSSPFMSVPASSGLGVTSSSLLQAVVRQEEEVSETGADASASKTIAFENGDARIFAFTGTLSKTDKVQGPLREMLMNARREYVARSIRRLQNSPNRQSANWALPIRSHPILTWSECLRCHATTKYRVMSKDAESLSFGRWLQLKLFFKAKNISALTGGAASSSSSNCKHSIFQDYVTYFECMGQVAGFEYEYFPRYSVSVDDGDFDVPTPIGDYAESWLNRTLERRRERVEHMWGLVRSEFLESRLLKYQTTFDGEDEVAAEPIQKLIESILSSEQYHQEILASNCSLLQLNRVRRELIQLVEEWNARLEEIVSILSASMRVSPRAQSKRDNKGQHNSLKALFGLGSSSSGEEISSQPSEDLSGQATESVRGVESISEFELDPNASVPPKLESYETEASNYMGKHMLPLLTGSVDGEDEDVDESDLKEEVSGDDKGHSQDLSHSDDMPPPPPLKTILARAESDTVPEGQVLVKSSSLDQMVQGTGFPLGKSPHALRMGRRRSASADQAEEVSSLPEGSAKHVLLARALGRSSATSSGENTARTEFANALAQLEKRTILLQRFEFPDRIDLRGHPNLSPGFGNRVVFVYEDEPTSWIAYALNSMEHRQRLFAAAEDFSLIDAFQDEKWPQVLSLDVDHRSTTVDLEFKDGNDQQGFKFSVRVYSPLHFYALRAAFCNHCTKSGDRLDVETTFLESLSRCTSWTTTGGKSKSQFFKSRDGRYIAKSITSEELDMFLSTANGYFAHLSRVRERGIPTALMRILGVYTLSSRAVNASSTSGGLPPLSPVSSARPTSSDGDASSSKSRNNVGEGEGVKTDGENGTTDASFATNSPEKLAVACDSRPSTPMTGSGTHSLQTPSPGVDSEGRTMQGSQSKQQSAAGFYGRGSQATEVSSRIVKTHLIVFENLFAEDKKYDVKFDLKGNLRNRYVTPAKEEDVLMDRNFQMYTNGFAVPLTEAAKDRLMRAVTSDTEFLEQEEVVDYSLLLGIPTIVSQGLEEDEATLRMGLIDFLQVYNMKKMIESSVKRAGMIAGQLEPTVIDPSAYRARFLRAMDKYFVGIPPSPLEELESDAAQTRLHSKDDTNHDDY